VTAQNAAQSPPNDGVAGALTSINAAGGNVTILASTNTLEAF
jgi:hypothetical protein